MCACGVCACVFIETSAAFTPDPGDRPAEFQECILSGRILDNVLLYGDALTEKMIKALLHSRAESPSLIETGGGILPACSDFHAQMHIGDLMFRTINPPRSDKDELENDPRKSPGTWANLVEETIDRRDTKPQFKDGFAANERAIDDVTGALITGLAMQWWQMPTLSSPPSGPNAPPENWKELSRAERSVVRGAND